MANKYSFPQDLELLRFNVLKAIQPIKEVTKETNAEKSFLFNAQRTDAGRELPEYYLCYFLLVDLLGFKNLGQFEKVSWSVPIDYTGTAYLIEHRKFGVGVFAQDPATQEKDAEEIVKRIKKAVKIASPFFEWKASEAAKESQLNVKNHHLKLFDKLYFHINLYKEKIEEADKLKDERIKEKCGNGFTISYPSYELYREAEWLAIAALDSFFSWTEHIFIHLSILNGKSITGVEVADLADSEWAVKFKKSIDTDHKTTKQFYDQLVTVKRQLRNYITHGAFGKRGEAFSFHSGAGAVPLLLPHQKGNNRFSFKSDLGFDDREVIVLIEKFIDHLWTEVAKPAKIYLESGLPIILTYAKNGSYINAMGSVEEMESLVEHLSYEFDRAANMDW